MWLVCFLTATGLFLYSAYTNIAAYLEYPVTTQITSNYENPTNFPTVTFCNINAFVTPVADGFVSATLIRNGVFQSVSESTVLASYFNYSKSQQTANFNTARNLMFQNAMNQNNSYKKMFGSSQDYFIIACFYNNEPCDLNEMSWYYHPTYGNCYQFNSGYNINGSSIDVKKTYKTGKTYGLTLILFTYTPDMINTLAFDTGAHIFITNQTESLYSVTGYDVAAGKATSFTIGKTFVDQLGSPYNDCYDDLTTEDAFNSYYYRLTIQEGYTYKQKDCINFCEQDYYLQKCNCTNANYPTINGAKYCSTLAQISCLSTAFSEIYSTNAYESFTSYCPLECSSESYQAVLSKSYFPSEIFASVLMSMDEVQFIYNAQGLSLDSSTLAENMVWLNVFYEETSYTLIMESAKTTAIGLLNNMGGILRLFIGISVLSFLEMIEIIFQLIFLLWEHRKLQIASEKYQNDKEEGEGGEDGEDGEGGESGEGGKNGEENKKDSLDA
jgi:hypothetical protein